MKRIYGYLVVGLVITSCGGSSAEEDKLKLEKEKIELEKKKLDFEKEKLNSGENSEKDEKSADEREEKKSKSVKQPSVSSQESVIYDFYRDFDNAYDQSSMREYIDNYYGSSIKPVYDIPCMYILSNILRSLALHTIGMQSPICTWSVCCLVLLTVTSAY
jgi:hypothetical protein